MQPKSPVENWLRAQRELMAKEVAFTDLALRAAAGEVSLKELEQERQELRQLRAHCTVLYERAFPNAQN